MRVSLASSVICAVVAIVVPFARAQGTLPQGTYRIESAAFDSPVLLLDLSASSASPGTPILISQDNGGKNQHWIAIGSGSGYTLTADGPFSNAFVESVGPGIPLTATPDAATVFLFNRVSPNMYQILAATGIEACALQAPADVAQVTLEALNATNLHQIWHMVPVI